MPGDIWSFQQETFGLYRQNEKVGGPKDLDMLFSSEEISSDFSNYEILVLEEVEIELSEGFFHNGIGSVIRFVGRKK